MKSPLVPSDVLGLVLAGDPQLGPDGRVFFVRTVADEARDENRTSIWVAKPGETPRAFTAGTSDRLPRLSPDGAWLAFVRAESDGRRVFALPLGGGEAVVLTPEPFVAIVALAWSPDGTSVAFAATAPHEPSAAPIAHDERSGARHIRRLPFKSDEEGLLDGRRRHLSLATLAGDAPRWLTSGDYDVSWPAWSPDGTSIAFCAAIGVPEASFINDVYTVDAGGGGEPRKITGSDGPKSAPSFSRSGREIACIGHRSGDDVSARFNDELLLTDLATLETRSLSADTDRPASDGVMSDVRGTGGVVAPVWTAGDAELVTLQSRDGTCGVIAFARETGAVRTIAGGEREISAFSYREDGALAFVFSTPAIPSDVALLDASGETTLTDLNPWLQERTIVTPRRVRPVAADGCTLDAFLLDPVVPATSSGAQPWVLQVHGGPHGAYGFAFLFEFQILASHGIGVAYGNPRGSQTYGAAYADAVSGRWGEVDVRDVHTIADAAEAHAAIDAARFAIAGGSYGGFMTTWMMGHSERFATGVSMRAVNEFTSEIGASDLGWFLERELDIPWGDDGLALFRASPMRAASKIRRPLLVIHSDRDFRCPIDQGEQLFTLLRRLGNVDAEFVRFTGDGHNLSRGGKPRNRMLRLRAIAHWLIRYLRPEGVAPVAPSAGSLFAPLATEPPGP